MFFDASGAFEFGIFNPGMNDGLVDAAGADVLVGAINSYVKVVTVRIEGHDNGIEPGQEFFRRLAFSEFFSHSVSEVPGDENELDGHFVLGDERFDECCIFFDIERVFRAGFTRNEVSVNFMQILGVSEFSIFVIEVKGDVTVASRVMRDGVRDIAAFAEPEITEVHDSTGIFVLHGLSG